MVLSLFKFSLNIWLRKVDRAFLRAANQPILAIGGAALFSLLVNGTLAIFLSVPPPAIHDEYSYWLAADTFAHGRLTNPPHPLWVHFESFHVLQQPTYASKYPPAQGLALAVGQVLTGQPIFGVWLSSALACAAIGWMLRAWVRPRWALLGSLLVALHPLMVDWNHSYWGGSVALLGGALVLGATRRIVTPLHFGATRRGARFCDGCWLATGMAVLANSRPYEGMILSVLALTTILVAVIRNREILLGPVLSRVFPPAGLILALTIAFMAYYNWRVTGNAFRMPYMVYQETYSASPSFLWDSPRPIPEYRHKEIRDFWLNFERPIYEGQQGLAGWLKGAAWKAGVLFHSAFPSISFWISKTQAGIGTRDQQSWTCQLFAPFVLLSLAGLPVALRRGLWVRIALLFLVLFYIALLPVVGMIGHYAAPVAGLFFYLMVESLRLIRVWRWSGMRVGQWTVRCLLLGWCLWLIPKAIDMNRSDPTADCHNQARERAAILNDLKNQPGRHLVIVRYSPKHSYHAEWVYNEADIDGAKVIWAREMDSEHNRQLLEYFQDRHIWLIEADVIPPRATPYSSIPNR